MPVQAPVTMPVIKNGEDGIGCYRIPSLMVMETGELLAMAEARVVNFRNYTTPEFSPDPEGRGQFFFRFGEDGSVVLPDMHTEHPEMPMPGFGLQGSIERYAWPDERFPNGLLLYSGSDDHDQRIRMTVWASFDEGETWPVKRLVDAGPSAFGDLMVLPDGRIALHYGRGNNDGMRLAVFDFDWLLDGTTARII